MKGKIFQLGAIYGLAWLRKAIQDFNSVVIRMQASRVLELSLGDKDYNSKYGRLGQLRFH